MKHDTTEWPSGPMQETARTGYHGSLFYGSRACPPVNSQKDTIPGTPYITPTAAPVGLLRYTLLFAISAST